VTRIIHAGVLTFGCGDIEDCWQQPGPNATHQLIQYSSFTDGQGTHPLYLDEYTPPGDLVPVAAVVSVHGGGWVGGCRVWNDGISYHLALNGFVVFNIDYRLACAALGSPVYLCGYHYPVPIGDVETAITWVRAHASTYAPFNGKVVAVGTSAGGNLSFMAAMTGTPGTTRPELVVGASGHPEMGYMSDLQSACSEAYGQSQQQLCASNSQAYFGYALDPSHDWCGDGGGDNWKVASPACNLPSVPVPVFIANATQELSAYRAATDFKTALDIKGQPRQLCSVSDPTHLHDHGTELLAPGVPCAEVPGQDVFTTMVLFIKANL
jgi:acetyl esterase/lipase